MGVIHCLLGRLRNLSCIALIALHQNGTGHGTGCVKQGVPVPPYKVPLIAWFNVERAGEVKRAQGHCDSMSGMRNRFKGTDDQPPVDYPVTKEERDRIVVHLLHLVANMVYGMERPSSRRISAAVQGTIDNLVRVNRSSHRQAAAALGVAPASFNRGLANGLGDAFGFLPPHLAADLLPALRYLPMHSDLDDALFPLIRIRVTANDLDYVTRVFDWLENEIQPRAHDENTKLVCLNNYSGFQGAFSDAFKQHLTAQVFARGDLNVVRGIVFLAPPHIPNLLTELNMVNAGNSLDGGGLIRCSTNPQDAFAEVAALFAAAGIQSLPPIHLD